MAQKNPSGPRNIALIGPYSSGKTSLLENMLSVAGATTRKGTIKEGNTVADGSQEARARQMSVEVSVASFDYEGERLTILDCPGSLELLQDTQNALVGVDAAVVVCEPETDRVVALMPLIRFLEDRGIPYMVFLNKLNRIAGSVMDFVSALREVTARAVVLRQLPIIEGEAATGYVDVIHRRGYSYQPGGASQQVDVPENLADDLELARTELLEAFADFDDTLLEKLLEDEVPPLDQIYDYLHTMFAEGSVVPVLIGAGEQEHGVRRLLKTLRHDLPEASVAAERVGLASGPGTVAAVLKTYNTPTSGKLSIVRIWRGTLKDGMTVNGQRVASVNNVFGQTVTKQPAAKAGEIVGLGRMDEAKTGMVLSENGDVAVPDALKVDVLAPVYAFAVTAENRADEVKMSDVLNRLVEEDPSLIVEADAEVHQLMLRGQGEVHLQVALDRAKNRYGLPLKTERPAVPYKETIRKSVSRIQGRHKKQSGGHGQFGDVFIDVGPQPRGAGFEFNDKISGGVVPKQYIPAVQNGVVEYCKKGPLGFPVVDVSVTLVFGSYHAVDSSEMAFQTAGRIAMAAAMPQCSPVLLEPIYLVQVHVPSEFTPQIQRLLSGRRGQILGFEPRDGWAGWDTVAAHVPLAEIHDLIIELRSLTRGVGTYDYSFDRLQELSGKLADDVVAAHAEAAQ